MNDRSSKLGLGTGIDFVARIDLEAAAERFRDTLHAEVAAQPTDSSHPSVHQGAQSDVFEVAGAIRWFDASKGYGFIVPEPTTPDVLSGSDDLCNMRPPLHPLGDQPSSAEGSWETASVSSFDAANGLGLLSVGSHPSPIYCHIETLRRSGYVELKSGQRVQIRWRHEVRGPTVAEIRPEHDRE